MGNFYTERCHDFCVKSCPESHHVSLCLTMSWRFTRERATLRSNDWLRSASAYLNGKLIHAKTWTQSLEDSDTSSFVLQPLAGEGREVNL